jgi:hypothetical protein
MREWLIVSEGAVGDDDGYYHLYFLVVVYKSRILGRASSDRELGQSARKCLAGPMIADFLELFYYDSVLTRSTPYASHLVSVIRVIISRSRGALPISERTYSLPKGYIALRDRILVPP